MNSISLIDIRLFRFSLLPSVILASLYFSRNLPFHLHFQIHGHKIVYIFLLSFKLSKVYIDVPFTSINWLFVPSCLFGQSHQGFISFISLFMAPTFGYVTVYLFLVSLIFVLFSTFFGFSFLLVLQLLEMNV